MELASVDLTSENLLKAFRNHRYLSWTDFSEKGIINGLEPESNRAESFNELLKFMELRDWIKEIPDSTPPAWEITEQGKNALNYWENKRTEEKRRKEAEENKFREEQLKNKLEFEKLELEIKNFKMQRWVTWISLLLSIIATAISLWK